MCRQKISQLELTLVILKPHITVVPHVLQDVRQKILDNGFYVVKTRATNISKKEAHQFYDEHRQKFFFNRLVTFMCSGQSHIHILAKENAIQAWRALMGPTKVFQTHHTHPFTIRGTYGLSDTRNAAHGSDSPESAEREIKVFFPEFQISEWYKSEEEKFINSQFDFDAKDFIHVTK